MTSPSTQPAQEKSERSRLKGCLILLLLPFLILWILYAYLLCVPTGYDKREDEARSAARDILISRLKPRKTSLYSDPNSKTALPPGQEELPPQSTSSTLPLDAPISDEEARFWWNARLRLEEKDVLFPQNGVSESVPWGYYMFAPLQKLNNPTPSDWMTDSTTGGWTLSSPALKFIKKERTDLNARGIQDRLGQITTSTQVQDTSHSAVSDVPSPIISTVEGRRTIDEMNRTERFLLEEGWKRTDCFRTSPSEFRGKGYRDPCRGEYRVILTIFRAFREGKPEKASRLIERCVLSSGRSILSCHDMDTPLQPQKMKSLERVLSWVADYPGTPEEILDWTAVTLASWELTPQEYTDLRMTNIAQDRQKADICFRKWDKAMNGWHLFLSGVPEKMTTQLAEPLLQRSLDRKTAALINLDPVEYEKAQQNLRWAMKALNFSERPPFSLVFLKIEDGVWDEESYYRVLIKDALTEDYSGRPLEEDQVSDFTRMAWEEKFRAGLFNRAIQMLRLSFATARYRRDHERYPGSVQELIPRYLDESFAPNSEQVWTLTPVEPFTALTLPPTGSVSGLVAKGFFHYFKDPRNKGQIPSGVEELKPYVPEGTDLSRFTPCFVRIEKSLLYSLLVRHDPVLSDQIQEAAALTGEPVPPQDEIAFRYQYFSIPPGNFEEGKETPPSPPSAPPPETGK